MAKKYFMYSYGSIHPTSPRLRRTLTTNGLVVIGFVFFLMLQLNLSAQKKEYRLQKDELSIHFSGYIKNDNFIDSRQIIGLRDDHLTLVAAPKILDSNGRDINSRGQFHMMAIETRMRTDIIGPPILDAQSSGAIEVDFIGPFIVDTTTDRQIGAAVAVNSLRMRHAYLQLDWERISLLAGQFWHPLVPPEHAGKNSITFQTAPFEGIARQPQIRLIIKPIDSVEIWGTLASQLDFKSNGPEGFSTKYIRNAIMPNLNIHTRYLLDDYLVIGASIDFKRLVPRLSTTGTAGTFKTSEAVDSFSAIVYAAVNNEKWSFLSKLTYGENLTDQVMFSGYAVTCRDAATGQETYTPTCNIAYIMELYKKGTWEPGIIIGVTKNIGTNQKLFIDNTQTGNDRFIIFGRGGGGEGNVFPQFLNATDYILGIQPRIKWYYDPFVIGAEAEILRVSYGDLTDKGRVINGKPVTNVRFTLAFYYYF